MIDRFNFYDVYGYLLPGVALLALLQAPHGAVTGDWSIPEGFTSALLAAAGSYIIGHLLQIAAKGWIPSDRALPGGRRYPSDYVLDGGKQDYTTLAPQLREDVADRVLRMYGLEIREERSATPAADRQDAFFRCRTKLVQEDAVRYAEQFQGMYAMMRGFCMAGVVAAAWAFGWFLGQLPIVPAVLIVASAFAFWRLGVSPNPALQWLRSRLQKRGVALLLLCVALIAGFLWAMSRTSPGSGLDPDTGRVVLPALLSVAYVVLSVLFYRSYQYYCDEFAMCVYRDFLIATEPDTAPPAAKAKKTRKKNAARKRPAKKASRRKR